MYHKGQRQSNGGVMLKRCSLKNRKTYKETPVLESFLRKVASGANSFFKKETSVQLFSSEFCETFTKIIFMKHLRWLALNGSSDTS